MSWLIYKHTNKKNGKVYIGQTKQDPERRWRDGEGYLKQSQDTHFSRAIRKYGWFNFWHEIIEDDIPNQVEANKRETFWIIFYDSVNSGYNSNYGGDRRDISKEVRNKMSKAHKGKKITGSHLENLRKAIIINCQNPERNKKISAKLKGRTLSEKHRLNISKKAILRIEDKNPFFGKHHTVETIMLYRKKMGKEVVCLETNRIFLSSGEAGNFLGVDSSSIRSACRIGCSVKIVNDYYHFYYKNEQRPVFSKVQVKKVYNVETNEIFNNLIDAGKSINKSSKLVGMCCRGNIQTAGGYHWSYFNDYIIKTKDEINELKELNAIGKGRRKKVICKETGIIYESTCHASKETGICQTSIAKTCSGTQKTAGGYHWSYL